LGAGTLDPAKEASLSMTLKSSDEEERIAQGAEVTVYLVAEGVYGTDRIDFVLTGDYVTSGIDIDEKITQSMIDDLAQFTSDNNITGQTAVSDPNGTVKFEGLKSGLYLVMGTKLPQGFTSFVPFLYYLPYYSADIGDWVYDGAAEPKIEYLEPVEVSVKKVWNDDGKNRPSYVTVALENEDGRFDTVRLDASNNWSNTWTGLDATKKWNIVEVDVPSEYKDTYSSEGLNFTVTNTRKLIQTGQTNWPVPVLVFTGSFLVCAGVIIRITGKRSDEE